MAKEAIYAAYKDGRYIGDYKTQQLHEKLGINPRTLYTCVSKCLPYKKHYTFKRKWSGNSNATPARKLTYEDLRMEWDRIRKVLNPNAI